MLLIISATSPGASAEFEVWRRGATTRLTANIGELGLRDSNLARQPEEARVDRVGLTLTELTARERQELATTFFMRG